MIVIRLGIKGFSARNNFSYTTSTPILSADRNKGMDTSSGSSRHSQAQSRRRAEEISSPLIVTSRSTRATSRNTSAGRTARRSHTPSALTIGNKQKSKRSGLTLRRAKPGDYCSSCGNVETPEGEQEELLSCAVCGRRVL